MISQTELIHNTEWDILLVLDAVRYDYFKEHCPLGLKGELQCCESPTTFTLGWIKETFGDKRHDDIVYLSSDPIKDMIKDYSKKVKHGNSFDMNKYFNVIDIYSDNFKEPGFITPDTINKYAEKAMKEYPKKRLVVKYWQAHDPYIYWIYRRKDFYTRGYKLGNFRKIIYELVSDELFWKICDKLGLPPENWLAALWLDEGKEGIILGYTKDLILCLHYCKKLIDKYPDKKFIITSDHGERLGPRYSHGGRRTKQIREVPWFVCESCGGKT